MTRKSNSKAREIQINIVSIRHKLSECTVYYHVLWKASSCI